jgi:hypothetical protein
MENLNDHLFSLINLEKVVSNAADSNESSINNSGNSDVDIRIAVDTTPIAFAMLCSLLASKQLSKEEFELAAQRLEDLTKNRKSHSVKESKNDKVKLFNRRRGIM